MDNIENKQSYNELNKNINIEQLPVLTHKKNQKALKLVGFALYTIVIIAITIFIMKITINKNMETTTGDVNPGKIANYAENYFDEFFSFGANSPVNLFSVNLTLNSNIISDIDKKSLQSYRNKYCNIYMGIKDGVDIIRINMLEKPYKMFSFASNLNYKFSDVIRKFEEKSGVEITNDFLIKSKFDDILKTETAGIIVYFEKSNDCYCPYYMANINGKLYII